MIQKIPVMPQNETMSSNILLDDALGTPVANGLK
jgi:hypothetical protein